MPSFAIETEELGRIYKIRGTKKEKAIRKELVALADVNLHIEQGDLRWGEMGKQRPGLDPPPRAEQGVPELAGAVGKPR